MNIGLAKNNNFDNLIWFTTFVFLISFSLIFNPFYVLILCALIEQIKRQPKILFWIVTSSIVMSITNREIGGGWGSIETGLANDDALIYLDSYIALKTNSYIGNPAEYLYKFLNGQEPVWYLLMEFIGLATNFNQDIMLFISVAVPVFIIHFVIYRSFRYPLFAVLVFYFISTEMIHTFYHLWRFSLALSLAILVIMLWKSHQSRFQRIGCYILPIIGHITMLTIMLLLFISNFLTPKQQHKTLGLFRKLKLLCAFIFSMVVLSLLVWVLLINFEFTKVLYYFGSTSFEPWGGLNPRFILQLSICIFLMIITTKPLVYVFALSTACLLLLPAIIDIPFIVIRLTVIFTPFISLFYCLEIENKKSLVYLSIICGSLIFLRLALNSGDLGHYQYMSGGEFSSVHAGLIYNLLGVLGFE